MKILFLNNLADQEKGGGGEVIVWEQMRALKSKGHECILLATSEKPGLERTEKEGITIWQAGIKNIYWPFHKKRPSTPSRFIWHTLDIYNPWMQVFLRKIVAVEKPDITSIHALQGWSSASWKILSRLGVPSVQILHGYESICVNSSMYKNGHNCTAQCARCRAFRLPHRKLSQHLQAVVGVSRYILEKHLSLGYFKNVPIQRVIHNARSPKSLNIDIAQSPTPHQGTRFGFIGRLHPTKGISLLIEAFLAVDLSDTELLIAGSGKEQYEAQLHSQVHSARIQLLGRVTPRDFYPQVDVVVVPSLWNDNLPGVVFEALAFGKPVIASRRGGIPEMIRDGENGLLFEPDSAGELESALIAMHDNNLRAKLTAQARSSSLPFTDIDHWASTYEALYQEVIEAYKRNPLV